VEVVEGREGLFIGKGVLRIGQEIIRIKSRGRSYYGEIPARDFRPEVRDDRGAHMSAIRRGREDIGSGLFPAGPWAGSGFGPKRFPAALYSFSFSFLFFFCKFCKKLQMDSNQF
jgi:hypothetical protein